MDKKEFVKVALQEDVETFVMHVTFLLAIALYSARKT